MPKYYVYDKKSGAVVHIHETYDASRGKSRRVDPKEVMSLVDESIDTDNLEILEEHEQEDIHHAERAIRVNPEKKSLEIVDETEDEPMNDE